MLQQARGGGGEGKGGRGASQRWRNNGGRSAGGCVAAVHVSLNILRPLSALDRGNSDNNFTSLPPSLSLCWVRARVRVALIRRRLANGHS